MNSHFEKSRILAAARARDVPASGEVNCAENGATAKKAWAFSLKLCGTLRKGEPVTSDSRR